MSSDDRTTSPNPTSRDPRDAASPRRSTGALRFVVVFSAVTVSLLTGYRFAIDTPLNDWYLFQVARHTAWTLDRVGYRAELEKDTSGGLNPREVRAVLSGTVLRAAPPPGAGLSPSEMEPLTAWETWRYRAITARKKGAGDSPVGPRVHFVLTPGVTHQIEDLEQQLAALPAGDGTRRAALESELQALRWPSDSNITHQDRRSRQGCFFTFIIIPECGAIEVMAIFLAAVLAFPAGWFARALGIVLGIPVMYGVNILRLTCLAYIGALDGGGKWYQFCHEYVWQAVYVIFVVVVWMAWVEFCVRRRTP